MFVEKKCNGCKELKSAESFHKNKTRPTGLANYCRECARKANLTYNLSPKGIEQRRRHFSDPKVARRNRTYQREWSSKMRKDPLKVAKLRAYQRQYRKDVCVLEKMAAYKRTPKYRATANARRKLRELTDPEFKLLHICRARLAKILGKRGLKSEATLELIGCSVGFLRKHLESNWLPGMSWENHTLTGWHVDHIRPCSSFDLTKKEERLRCFHWSNLQPLWCEVNLKKSNSYAPNLVVN